MQPDVRVVDNQTFLLGLDNLYRERMRAHESGELLLHARQVAAELQVPAAAGPVEGYYTESYALTEYFLLMRALQQVPGVRGGEVRSRSALDRLQQVTSAPLYGTPKPNDCLLPACQDPLTLVLERTPVWTIEKIVHLAYEQASHSDDFSLVALAALSSDAVALAALRESVVLYAAPAAGSSAQFEPVYEWKVDEEITRRATRFVEAFNTLFNEDIPAPGPESAATYYNWADSWNVVGRCVRIGFDPTVNPTRHYHWGIVHNPQGNLEVQDFWDDEVWTTDRFRRKFFPDSILE